MNKLIFLGIATTLGAAKLALVPQGTPVNLQATTPGVEQTGHLNISGTATVGLLRSQGTVFGEASSPTGISYGGFFTAASNQARGFYGYASSPTGLTYGGFFQNASSQGRAVYGLATATSGNNYGGYFQSASTDGRGILGVAASATGTTYGVYGKAVSPNGYGVYSDGNMGVNGVLTGNMANFGGTNANQVVFVQNVASVNDATALKAVATGANGTTTGGYFVSLSPMGRGVYGYAPATGVYGEGSDGVRGVGGSRGVFGSVSGNSGVNYGVWGETASTGGIGTFGYATASTGQNFGVYGHSLSTTGVGVYGESTASTGINLGVWGKSTSTQGTGVWGETTATSGTNQGVYGISRSPDGFGVYGHGTTGTGVLGTSNGSLSKGVKGSSNGTVGTGVYGISTGDAGDGVNGTAMTAGGAGVYGSGLSSGYGVFSSGNFGCTGGKSFLIDHPSDPENKYLVHYSTESPSPQNFYVGNVKTDGTGYAWVELPTYFADINENFKYQLTIVDDADEAGFVQVKVSKKIQGNRFQIRTSAPNTEVSWRVDADRNDLWMRRNPPKDVVEKEGRAKGKYLRPELYNLGPEFGDHYDPTIDKPLTAPPAAEAASRSRKK